jgi:hypothetical protein
MRYLVVGEMSQQANAGNDKNCHQDKLERVLEAGLSRWIEANVPFPYSPPDLTIETPYAKLSPAAITHHAAGT